jgi:hypothetical protein
MYAVFYTLKFDAGVSGEPTSKDTYQIVKSREDAQALLQKVQTISADNFYCGGIGRIEEATEPHWMNSEPMGLED